MLSKDILEKLSYACKCPLDVKADLGIINGVCPKHPKNALLVDGIPIETYKKILKRKLEKSNAEVK